MSFNHNIPLSIKGFELREITNNAIFDLFEIYSDKEILRYTDSELHKTLDDTHKFIAKIEEKQVLKLCMYIGIFSKTENKLIGTLAIYDINYKHSFASIACVLNKKYWRKGIMTSGIQALIDYSFTTLNLNRLEAQVFEFHTASIALFRKLKFTEEGILRKNFLIEGKFENSIMYSMLNVGNL